MGIHINEYYLSRLRFADDIVTTAQMKIMTNIDDARKIKLGNGNRRIALLSLSQHDTRSQHLQDRNREKHETWLGSVRQSTAYFQELDEH